MMNRTQPANDWALRLFRKSPFKLAKYRCVVELLSDTRGLHCLDIGSHNGAMSYLLSQRGGHWSSADLEEKTVRMIKDMVGHNVFYIEHGRMPFEDDTFDRVVIIDCLEHIKDDRAFIGELFRIIKPQGCLIINTPHRRETLLRRLRLALGDTDEKHGHVRPGYTRDDLDRLLAGRFTISSFREHSKFFSELVDIAISTALVRCTDESEPPDGGIIVSEADLERHRHQYRVYSLIYPLIWFILRLDTLLPWSHGYLLIVNTRSEKPHGSA